MNAEPKLTALSERQRNSAGYLSLYSSLIEGSFPKGGRSFDATTQQAIEILRSAKALFSQFEDSNLTNKGNPNQSPKSFVVVEGIDGAGKSTLINALNSRLSKRGIRCISFQELPDDSCWQAKKDFLFRNLGSSLEDRVCFSHLTRIQRLDKIWSESSNRDVVFLDRYYYTWLAYLHVSAMRALANKNARMRVMSSAIKSLCYSLYCNQLPRPNLTIYLSCSPAVSISRIRGRGDTIRHTRPKPYFRELNSAFQMLISKANCVTALNAENEPGAIARRAEALVMQTL